MKRGRRSTQPGEHRPVLLDEVLSALKPQPGEIVVDCTVGWAGHAIELMKAVGPTGKLIGIDFDSDNLPKARERLAASTFPFSLHQGNFAGLQGVLAAEGIIRVDMILADLGMSSMQVDDAERGFSYVRDGPLDMRMDRSRGRTAGQVLATISKDDLIQALQELGDEPEAERIADVILEAREREKIERTTRLADLIAKSVNQANWHLHPERDRWVTHPAARAFQALRILVNRELANLENLLRVLPDVLRPGSRAAIISFHSGEDRLVKSAFREGLQAGWYSMISEEPGRATFRERTANPRSRSAKLRWAMRNRDS
jgi:16S rRNA (cytosine1402-N4)-methyltransferase